MHARATARVRVHATFSHLPNTLLPLLYSPSIRYPHAVRVRSAIGVRRVGLSLPDHAAPHRHRPSTARIDCVGRACRLLRMLPTGINIPSRSVCRLQSSRIKTPQSYLLTPIHIMDTFASFDVLTTRLVTSRYEHHHDDASAPAVLDTPIDVQHEYGSPALVCVIL